MLTALLCLWSGTASAQGTGTSDAGLSAWTPTTDLYDLLRAWRKKPPPEPDAAAEDVAFTIVPIIGSKPSTGFRFGVGADIQFPLGDPADTRISAITTAATISTQKQPGIFATPSLYGAHNRWRLDGDNHYTVKRLGNNELGTGSSESQTLDFDSIRFTESYYYRVLPNLYLGAGLVFKRQSDIRSTDAMPWDESAFVNYSEQHGFALTQQTSAGPSVNLVYDNRDNQNDAWRGWYASAVYTAHYQGFLGGDSDWQRATFDVRTYAPLVRSRRHELAFWIFSDFVTGGTPPYFGLPAVGEDPKGRSARGYTEGRFRGERLVTGEAEYRGSLLSSGVLGLVAFVNTSTLTNLEQDQHLFDNWEIGGGAGLRFLLHKRSRTNICLDFGVGRGSHGIYVGLTEAF